MLIQYVANNIQRRVKDSVGKHLIARKIAREIKETSPEPAAVVTKPATVVSNVADTASADAFPNVPTPDDEAADTTEKPKRGRYRRADMTAEE